MDISASVRSRPYHVLLAILAALIVLLLVLKAGVSVGYQKARSSYQWGERYHEMFGGPTRGLFNETGDTDFVSGHGTAGAILSMTDTSIIIQGTNNIEKIITITPRTTILRGRTTLTRTDLRANDRIVVIGTPSDNGSMNAQIIRLFPLPRTNHRLAPPYHFPPFIRL